MSIKDQEDLEEHTKVMPLHDKGIDLPMGEGDGPNIWQQRGQFVNKGALGCVCFSFLFTALKWPLFGAIRC